MAISSSITRRLEPKILSIAEKCFGYLIPFAFCYCKFALVNETFANLEYEIYQILFIREFHYLLLLLLLLLLLYIYI